MTDLQGNIRLPVRLADGLVVETVWYGSGTLCISCQGGCAVGCPFCASGAAGLLRQLSADEMHRQVAAALAAGATPSRITVSGIGEPLHNLEPVLEFMSECRWRGLPTSLTTTGAPIDRLAGLLRQEHNGLMLSVHAGSAKVHRQLIPRGPDFAGLWGVLAEAWPRLSRRQRRKIGINYLLLAGVNDAMEEIDRFCALVSSFEEATVHLLTLNAVAGNSFASPGPAAVDAIFGHLRQLGIHVRRANRWRRQPDGGCGTLLAHSRPVAGRISADLC